MTVFSIRFAFGPGYAYIVPMGLAAKSWPERLLECDSCPRTCRVDRSTVARGFCNTGTDLAISSICAHKGEEPVISGPDGICNIFFAHCNLQCVYCQNHQISDNRSRAESFRISLNDAVDQIEQILDRGARGVGFVSPSHALAQMHSIMDELDSHGRKQTYVYNTNGYDLVQTIQLLEDRINVYLPDLKYMEHEIAAEFSGAHNYPDIATAAIKEMFRQCGADIELDADGYITRGIIIRHLVLPGQIENSKKVLRFIARELSPDIHISLMSQYCPTPQVSEHPILNRPLFKAEYDEVLREFDNLGLHRGWVQDISSAHHYRPDFDRDHPFEH